DLREQLAETLAETKVLLICTARIELLEMRPTWGAGKQNATSLSLAPLSPTNAAHLMSSLLGEVQVPHEVRDLHLAEQGGHQVRGVCGRQRRKRERRRVLLARAPGRAHLEQLDPGGADKQHLRLREGLGKLLAQVEQGAGGPVDVFDRKDRQVLATESRDVSRPSVLQPPDDLTRIARGGDAGH